MKLPKNYKACTYFTGTFEAMTPPVIIDRVGKKIQRSLITITTEDGQTGFFEARDRIIGFIEANNIKIGQKVKVGFVFMGSQKEDRQYNNIFINEIEITD